MELEKKYISVSLPKHYGFVGDVEEESSALGIVKYARAFGRKKILISNNGGFDFDSSPKTPLKKLCGHSSFVLNRKISSSSLEALPQDMDSGGVDHEYLSTGYNNFFCITVFKSVHEFADYNLLLQKFYNDEHVKVISEPSIEF